MTLKEKGLAIIKKLVADFDKNLDYVKSENVKEDVIRIDFIDPFFEALGWDIRNKNGQLPTEREVYYEDTVLVERRKKQPDYGFTKKGEHRFFVEAKKPSIFLPDSSLSALQLRSYGWSKQLKISVLTNFEHFVIYDCNIEPQATDVANIAALKTIHYKDYEKNFEYLWTHFAKENIYNGNFDALFDKIVAKGTMTVDKAFLRTLELQRDYLATGIITKNPQIDEDDLNFLVQNILDRIIFLRICEDREVEPNDQLKQTIKIGNAYQNLVQLFKSSADKYNSSLFDFEKDVLSPSIEIDNKVIQYVIGDLYFPKSPYQFSVIGTEILGTAYERFLGKIITITKAKSVEIDEKPEVRKAGGVYYTPQYIVNEIVKQTIGKKIAGKTPKEIEDLSILDPSCGSGSFLLGAYQFLLDWYLNYYYQQKLAKPKDKTYGQNYENVLTQDDKLRTEEKKRILLAHIYGVDIDLQAVEVTKLSLALKAMEGETVATINTQLKFFKRRVLPNLDNNVQCGNSLIGHDFYEKDIFLTPKEKRKINTFEWAISFAKSIKKGGFDIVIGNPPYVQPNLIEKNSYEYIKINYQMKLDLYATFIEKALSLSHNQGMLGYIVPSLFLKGVRYKVLRNLINSKAQKFEVTEYSDKVFADVKMPTCIIILEKGKNTNTDYFRNNAKLIFSKVITQPLSSISVIRRGLEIGRNKLLNSGAVECITGGNLDSYFIKSDKFISEETYQIYKKNETVFLSPKILVRETGNNFFATIDYKNTITTRSIYNVKIFKGDLKSEFILGILNSNLFRFYFKSFISPNTNIFPKIRIVQLGEIPIPVIDFANSLQKTSHDNIAKYVSEILELKIELSLAKIPSKKKTATDKFLYYMSKIDTEVYKLYDLTPEEIATIEV